MRGEIFVYFIVFVLHITTFFFQYHTNLAVKDYLLIMLRKRDIVSYMYITLITIH